MIAVEPILGMGKAASGAGKALAAFLTPHAEESLALLASRGIAAFRTPEACADALAAFLRWRAPREPPRSDAPAVAGKTDPFEFFTALGVPVAPWQIAHPPDYAHGIDYPVAVKLAGTEHKTEKRALRLDIQNRGPETFIPELRGSQQSATS